MLVYLRLMNNIITRKNSSFSLEILIREKDWDFDKMNMPCREMFLDFVSVLAINESFLTKKQTRF